MIFFNDLISLASDPALAKQGRKGLSTALKKMHNTIRENRWIYIKELKKEGIKDRSYFQKQRNICDVQL